MVALHSIIDDEVAELFKAEVFRRKGLKKGNIKEALEEAMRLWAVSDDAQKLKNIAMNEKLYADERKVAREKLAGMGLRTLNNLLDIANDTKLPKDERTDAMKLHEKYKKYFKSPEYQAMKILGKTY